MELKEAFNLLEGTVLDIKDEHVHKDPGGKSTPAGAAYAHIIVSADSVINGMILHKPFLLETKMNGKGGFDLAYPPYDEAQLAVWLKKVKVDMAQLKSYEKEIRTFCEEYVSGLTDDDLDKKIEVQGMGEMTIAYLLGTFLIGHINNHCGEISAVKGLHGTKGYPF